MKPADPPLNNRAGLCRQTEPTLDILGMLDRQIAGSIRAIDGRSFSSIRDLNAREDIVDSIVCCAVAITALDGRVKPFGDETAAISIPITDLIPSLLKPDSALGIPKSVMI